MAQAMITSKIDWHIFYLMSLAWSAIAFTVAATTFRPTQQERADELAAMVNGSSTSEDVDVGLQTPVVSSLPKSRSSTFARLPFRVVLNPPLALSACLKTPLILAYCAFLFVYSGSETSANGFVSMPPQSPGWRTHRPTSS